MKDQYNVCSMTAKGWMCLLLFCLCCHHKIQAAEKQMPDWMSKQFPCDVTLDNISEVTFDCGGRHLHEVPSGITSNATVLNLTQNNIQNISGDVFSTLVNLITLDLSWANNKKPVNIDRNIFQNLPKLNDLRLTGIKLVEIPRNIPPSVRTLDLNNNHIALFDNRSLAGLANVTQLGLYKNCFMSKCRKCRKQTIMDGSFAVMTKLQGLDLSFNNLTKVPKGFPQSLTLLKLDSNRIQSISEHDFLDLHNLKVLQLQGNCPRCQNAPYSCVPCQDSALKIHGNAFDSLTQLVTLHLGGNSLEHINPSWFQKLENLKELYLSFNFLFKAITGEEQFLTNIPKLEKLDLSFNFPLKTYPPTINLSQNFSKLSNLRTLHLQALVFQKIGQDTLTPLYNLKNLSALNLGTNFIIHSNATIFKKLPQLKMIYLAENRLYPIPGQSLPLLSDEYNKRSDVTIPPLLQPHPKDFDYEISHRLIKQECFDSGRVLILSSNNLFFISPKQFDGYGNIACLNLSRNGFSAAPNGVEFTTLPNLTYLDLSFNKIDLAYDDAFKELQKLQVLDLSYNPHYFQAYGITHNLNFTKNLPVLRVLNMSHNSISTLTTKQMHSQSLTELQFTNNELGTLWKTKDGSYEMLFTNLTNLKILNISYNSIGKIPDSIFEYLPRNLTLLCISHNKLTNFHWHQLKWFSQLEVLDLSFNKLSNMSVLNPDITHTLTFLDLSYNHIFHLDDGFTVGPKSLTTLSLSNNKLTIINQSKPEQDDNNINNTVKTLYLNGNPFQCTCESFNFIRWIENTDIKIPRLTPEVACATPANQKGQVLIDFDINLCMNDTYAYVLHILTTFFIIASMFAAMVAHLFYWDASYVMLYVNAKLKGYRSLNSTDSIYDVFVTYDTSDPYVSEWVMKNLRVKLEEEGEKYLPLCLEERDWPLGVPLVENLTQSIRYSRKTLFVLTQGYVKTGVFKLAMYLAHQRLLDENMDVIVLLMLEPVLQHSRFLRLRRWLCGESVVEWPRTAAAEPWFWQNLRNVVRVDNNVIYNKSYSKYFTR